MSSIVSRHFSLRYRTSIPFFRTLKSTSTLSQTFGSEGCIFSTLIMSGSNNPDPDDTCNLYASTEYQNNFLECLLKSLEGLV